jgi:site-specific DNA recombinase
VQPPIIDKPTFDRVQLMITGRATEHAQHKPHRARHPYALRGCVWCGLCTRRMQGHWVRDITYYRCRFPAEYALADRVEHPLSVYLREDAVIGEVNRWISHEFAPHRLNETIHDLAAVPLRQAATLTSVDEEIARKIAECDRKLAGYRATLDAGADPRIVATWITETEAEKARHQLSALPAATARRMSEAEIKSIVDRLADIARVLIDAERRQGRSLPSARTQADLPPWEETRGSKRATRTIWVFRDCPRGDLNPETGEISLIMDLNSKTGEKSPDREFMRSW